MILYPVTRMIHNSIAYPRVVGMTGSMWVPAMISFDNFRVALAVMDWQSSLPFTMMNVTVIMLLQMFSAALAGYAFARLKFRGMGIIFILVLLTFVIPSRFLFLPQGVLFRSFDPLGLFSFFGNGPIVLFGRPMALFLMSGLGMGIAGGLFIYIFRQFFRGLPKELEEAAYVDGSGVLRSFFTIVLPMAKPAFLTVGTLSFIWNWTDPHFFAQFNPDLRFMSLRIQTFDLITGGTPRIHQYMGMARTAGRLSIDVTTLPPGNPAYDAALMSASTFVSIIPLIILFLIVQKQFVQGVERSGIVG